MSTGAAERTAVVLRGDNAEVEFGSFGLDAYETFLKVKQLPEKHLAFDAFTGTYKVTTPARFAHILDPSMSAPVRPALPLASHLFDYQAWVDRRALEAKRFACWLDTGLGKTPILLEFARQVVARTGGRSLILSPPGLVLEQTCEQAARFYGEGLRIDRLATRGAVAEWCARPGPGLAITNYEKLIPGEIGEMRRPAGLIADESSILKTGGGKIKWHLIRSARGIEYKLSCTATPAPNETMEYASQAAFLETIRHEGEVLWTWFRRDKNGDWSVKPHARPSFYRWLASWSMYLRDPARFGWKDVLAELPEPQWSEERLPLTAEQQDAMYSVLADSGSGLFAHSLGVRERTKLAQIARGFIYEGTGAARRARRIPSAKALRVAEITRAEAAAGRPVIVWTVFDEEAAILAELLADLEPVTVDGSVPESARSALLGRFLGGHAPVLITKAQVGGYGLNLQRAKSMVFSGFDDSAERMYQAVRRAYRYGQTDRLRVFIPYVPELEGLMFANIRAKERRFMDEVQAQETEYLQVIRDGGLA